LDMSKSRQEPHPPRVFFRLLPPQHGHPAVDGQGELGVLPGAEDGAGAGVGVEEGEVLGAQGEEAARVLGVLGAGGEEEELGGLRAFPSPEDEDAEL
jgi:hypothetical protein